MWLTNLVTFIFLFFLGFLIRKFKLANLISGYNTLSKTEKEKYDTLKLTKITGNMLMTSSLFLLAPIIPFLLNRELDSIYFIISWIAFTLYIIISVINMNMNSNTVKRDKQ